MPRQVMNWAPNRLTTTGGTPRRVASRPNAATPSGWVRKKPGVFHTLVISASRSSGVGRAAQRLDGLLRGHLRQQPVLGVVDQLGLLALLDRLDGQPQLLGDLVVRAGVQVGDPGVHVEQRRDRPQRVLARAGLVVDVGLGQRLVGAGALFGVDGDLLGVDHPVDPVDARLDRHPAQQVQQPARGDRRELRNGLGRVGELPGSEIAECLRLVLSRRHVGPSVVVEYLATDVEPQVTNR